MNLFKKNANPNTWKHNLLWFCAFILLSVGLIYVEYTTREIKTTLNFEQQYNAIKKNATTGDIILRSGTGFWSDRFRAANTHDKRFSHVGIIKIIDGEFHVLHASGNQVTGSGVVSIVTLENFIAASKDAGLVRLKTFSPEIFLQNAEAYINTPFDWEFDKNDDSKIYCTELIYWSLKKIDPNFSFEEVDGFILPEACLDPNYFEEIKIDF